MKELPVLLLLFSLISCENHKDQYWSEVDFNAKISSNQAFFEMDEEGFVGLGDNPTVRKTSDVTYSEKDLNSTASFKKDHTFENLICSANFNHSDTLFIDIGFHSWFSGSGFVITYFDRNFITQPYSYADVIVENETRSTYKILSQKLTLNKTCFAVEDSLYGSVEFRIVETNGKLQTRHAANGFFRTKINR